MRAAHALVLGKFYPPHQGHQHLIDVAAQGAERVTVLVLGRSDETLSLATRVGILASEHAHQPHVEVVGTLDENRQDYDDPDVWAAHQSVILSVLTQTSNIAVNAVFTSESYGDELARRLDARHVLVNSDRLMVPISATLVRANPLANQDFLSPSARAALARRIVFLGAESTGTTTLSERVSSYYRARRFTESTQLVPEYGHLYCERKLLLARVFATGERTPEMGDLEWTDDEFVAIATEQRRQEDVAARGSGLLLICDTDAFTTQVWQERYTGHVTDAVADLASPHDLYLVTHHDDVPFVQDGTRDGEHLRAAMTDIFISRLARTRRPYRVLTGSASERLDQAVATIDALLAPPWWPTPDYARAPMPAASFSAQ